MISRHFLGSLTEKELNDLKDMQLSTGTVVGGTLGRKVVCNAMNASDDNQDGGVAEGPDGVKISLTISRDCSLLGVVSVDLNKVTPGTFSSRGTPGKIPLSSTAVVTVTTLQGVRFTHTFTGLSGEGSLAGASTKFSGDFMLYLYNSGFVMTK